VNVFYRIGGAHFNIGIGKCEVKKRELELRPVPHMEQQNGGRG